MINFSIFLNHNPEIIKYPLLTDKTTKLLEKNQYSFKVNYYSNKTNIKLAIESLFNVKVLKINTCNLPKKNKRISSYKGLRPKYKKAIIKLIKGNIINLFNEN